MQSTHCVTVQLQLPVSSALHCVTVLLQLPVSSAPHCTDKPQLQLAHQISCTLLRNHSNTVQCVISHEFVVLADGLWYLGFGDPHSLYLETRSHADEVLLQCRLQVLANLVWEGCGGCVRGVAWMCEGCGVDM